jgi:hypothetical protein
MKTTDTPRRIEQTDNGFAVFVQPPAFAGSPPTDEVRVDLTADQYRRFCLWLEGHGPIQKLLGDVSRSDREKLMTGLDDELSVISSALKIAAM